MILIEKTFRYVTHMHVGKKFSVRFLFGYVTHMHVGKKLFSENEEKNVGVR